jgi:branched-chain amino acid transport system substrate-binding protein
MAKKDNPIVLLITLIVTLLLLGGGFFLIRGFLPQFSSGNNTTQNPTPSQNDGNVNPSLPIQERLSGGNQLLISSRSTSEKQAGIQALSNKNYPEAIANFQSSLQKSPNDPEALIYLNNAKIGDNQSYTIAVAVPTNVDVDGAQEILRGVAQAQDKINQNNGIKGVKLKVLIANDDNDPQVAQQVAQALVNDPTVLGVVGHWASDVTIATGEIYQKDQLVAISPISTSVKLSGFGNYIFRTVPSDRFAGGALSRYQVQKLNKQKTAVFYNSQSNYSKSLKDEFTTALFGDGGAVVAEFDFKDNNFNAANAVKEAKEKGAQVLMLATNTATLDQALQVMQVNDGELALLAGDDAYAPKILQIGRRSSLGMIIAIPWHILAHPQDTFTIESRKLWQGDVSWRTAMAYDATQALIQSLNLSGNPTRETIQQALSSSNFKAVGAGGEITFLPSGDRNQSVQLVKIVEGNRSGFGFDFEPVNN